ncbi:MAG TPA: lipase family protein [Solirubrobacteraceae bacterium]
MSALAAGALAPHIAGAFAPAPGPVTPPADDPFYTPPPGFSQAPDGAVLRSRSVTATAYGAPLPAHAWQLLYRSEDSAGGATAEVTTVMIPNTAWTGQGARPVVSYQTAEDSVGSQCAPSYAIRTGLAADSNAQGEVGTMAGLLQKGWAVVTSDYEGPQSQFLAGRQEGHGVLDGIRAALSDRLDGLGSGDPVALWGYSGGAFTSSWAAELQPRYAPELRFRGLAIGGDPADLLRSFAQVDGSYGFGLAIGGMIGLERAFPRAGIGAMFTPAGQRALAASREDCTDELLARYPFGHIANYTYDQRPLDQTPLSRTLVLNGPLGKGAPSVETPVYDYHAIPDELVPVAVDDELVAGYCAARVPVQKVRYSYGDHNSTLFTGAPGAEQFLAERFAGQPIVDTCPPRSAGSGARARRRTVIATGPRSRARPGSISLAARPPETLVGIRWRRWGTLSATARARFVVAGRAFGAYVTVGRLRQCAVTGPPVTDVFAYTRLRYVLSGRLPRGLHRRSLRRLGCPRQV